MEFVIEVGEVGDTGKTMSVFDLDISHQECGRVVVKSDPVNPHHHLTCEGCGQKVVVTAAGITEIMYTAIDQEKERDISAHLADGVRKCVVVPSNQ